MKLKVEVRMNGRGSLEGDDPKEPDDGESGGEEPLVELGGQNQPPDCWTQHHTAVVVPYYGQAEHLQHLLFHLHPFLQRQQLHYAIYVVNQPHLLFGCYHMLEEGKDLGHQQSSQRPGLLAQIHQRWQHNGINSLGYRLLSKEKWPLYTNLTVDINF
ncbi:beta-1,4-galactosyltransferase 3-like [Cynocephalus volans]|uniref:beta-1,4-galactosyltransferase 3-like n=1 Tax=Cynocephalus volans TaxID=110931 RepID=UPI002FC9C211